MGKLRYINSAGRFEHTEGARVVWRTDAAPAFLLPAANTLTWSGNISYPDFVKGNLMYYGAFHNPLFPVDQYSGTCWAVVRAGDWGPGGSGGYLLSRISLGSVPAGCNYLEATMNLSHTHVPSQFFYVDCTFYQKEGVDIDLDGGSAKLEGAAPFRRIIKVVKDVDGSVWLERYQSVAVLASAAAQYGIPLKSGGQVYGGGATGVWENLATHDGDPSGWLAYQLGVVSSGDLHMMRGGSNAPSSTDTSDFSSTWAATLTVRPGYAHT